MRVGQANPLLATSDVNVFAENAVLLGQVLDLLAKPLISKPRHDRHPGYPMVFHRGKVHQNAESVYGFDEKSGIITSLMSNESHQGKEERDETAVARGYTLVCEFL